MKNLGPIKLTPKLGHEPFQADKADLGIYLRDFWKWSVSDLVSNVTRGRLAEFIVANALGISTAGVREEWRAFDLETKAKLKIEVKSAAYIQSWNQKQLSSISFLVPKTRYWDAQTNRQSKKAKRHADIYIFALLVHQDKDTIEPLNMNQWRFYVLSTQKLNERERSQHSITLKSLEKLSKGSVGYSQLKARVERV